MSNRQPARLSRTFGIASIALLMGTLTWSTPALAQDTPVDYNGDAVSDFVITRTTGGAVTWWVSDALTSTYTSTNWGSDGDWFLSGDFDGDGTSDIVIWRPVGPAGAGFWIRPSLTGVAYFVPFGVNGDDPSVLGDYDGDGKTDVAVFRRGATAGTPSYWFYKRSIDGVIVGVQWGMNPDYPAPGDYDGDGRYDFAVQRNAGGYSVIWINQSTAGITNAIFGVPTDLMVPGDYDGDGKTDLAVVRNSSGAWAWWVRRSSDGVVTSTTWGFTSDTTTQGDYDGDGVTDIAVWRPGSASVFWVLKSTGGGLTRIWGTTGDFPVANFNTH